MSARLRIGVDLGGTKIESVAMAPDGAVVARRRVPTPQGDYAGTLVAIAGLVDAIEREAGRPRGPVGIGIPGAVSPKTGRVKNANSVVLNGRPLLEDLEAALGRPVRLRNDANCFALSEATDGSGRGYSTVFGVILGTGVGGGLVVDGALVTGANAIAGEWGHNPLPWPTGDDERPGPDCYCGRTGCLETFLSGPGLRADHVRNGGKHSGKDLGKDSGKDLGKDLAPHAIVAGEDAACRATLHRYIDRLARGLASVINLLDPDVIVLGGGLSQIAALYEEVPKVWDRHIFSDHVATRLLPPAHGDSSGVRGAAWLWPA